jgi:molecular chaperone GrpE
MTEDTTPQEESAARNHKSQEAQSAGEGAETSAADLTGLNEKLEEARRLAETYRDQLLRKAAEFENYKRRAEADYSSLIRNANESLLSSLLPILDDFHRSLKSGKDLKDTDAFYRGIELIASKLTRTLELEGLKPFESVGHPFDVQYHDALLQVPRSDVPPHTVIEEVERGYMLNDRVLRHAKVIVSTAPELPGPPPSDPPEQEES